jgi:hypothetical protein
VGPESINNCPELSAAVNRRSATWFDEEKPEPGVTDHEREIEGSVATVEVRQLKILANDENPT